MKTLTVNHIIATVCLIVFSIQLHAQDLIVTNDGDSLNCKITNIKSDNIYFTFKHGDEIRNTLLPVSKIVTYQIKYYSTAEVPIDKIKNNEIYPRFRIAVSGGWSYRTAQISKSIPSDFNRHYQKLKSGFHYDLGISHYFSELFGVGFKYNEFLTSNETQNVYITYPDGYTEYGSLKDSYRIKFIGPMFCTRFFNSTKKNCLLIDIGFGYIGFQDKGHIVSIPAKINGNTVGFYSSIGYDIGISKDLSIGFQLSAVSGILTQVKRFDGISTETVKFDKNDYEDISRIDLSIGLRFNK